jgi:hypothetical protein
VDRYENKKNANCTRTRMSYLFVSMELPEESMLTADMRSGQSDSWCHLFKLQRQSFLVREKLVWRTSDAEGL